MPESFKQLTIDQDPRNQEATVIGDRPRSSETPGDRGVSKSTANDAPVRSRVMENDERSPLKSDEASRGRRTGTQRLYNPENDIASFGNSEKALPGSTTLLSKSENATTKTSFSLHQRNKASVDRASPLRSFEFKQGEDVPLADTIGGSQANSDQREGSDPSQDLEPELLLQPETRPVPYDQLVDEVKGIYGGLVVVEAKCIEVDEKQTQSAQERDPIRQTKLTSEQYSALIALHKTLLNEHHDFFLATQHPSATAALRRLPAKYSIPARMWRHGIHAFLEVLRFRLPDSLDHMLAFIYIAYSMMALLYETVPGFEDTWIESLGDLSRYRMAIEEDDIADRENWSGVARSWYRMAVDRNPKVSSKIRRA